MSLPSLSNVFSDVHITGNCVVKGTISSLAGSITSQWTTTGSSIYYTTGNVGIGTATPSSILNVNVTSAAANSFTTSSGTSAYQMYVNTADSRRTFVGMDGTGLFAFSTGALALGTDNTPIIFAPSYGGGEKMRITTSGLVGIGTTNPGSTLTVSGAGSFGSGYQTFSAPTGGLIVQGNVGIGTSNPGVNALQVSGNVVTSGFTSNSTNTVFNFDTLSVPFVSSTQVLASSSIGIGTTSPNSALEVYGTVISRQQAPAFAFLGDIDTAKWATKLGGYNLSFMSDSGSFTGFENITFLGRTYQTAVQMTSTGGMNVKGSVGIGTAGPGYALDVVNDINCSGSFRQNGILQTKITALTTFTAVTSFDAGGFDLVNFNNVEIRVIPYFNTTGSGQVTIQALDTSGTVYSPGEYSWQVFRGTTSATYAGSASALVIPNTELATNGVGPFICIIRITGQNGLTGSQRFHVEWDSTGCYAGVGASQTIGRCYFATTNIQINRIRFNLSAGTMTGKYSLVHYV